VTDLAAAALAVAAYTLALVGLVLTQPQEQGTGARET